VRHPLPRERLEALLGPEPGLSGEQARERRARWGSNAIVDVRAAPWRELARDTASDPMIWFFAGVSALYALVGQPAESLTLLAALVPLVGMDVYLHRRTQASTEGLRTRLATTARVVRDGVVCEVAAIDVVPGDVAIVRAGEAFAADGIVVAGADLQAEESSLTGEAYPLAKRPLDTVAAGPEPFVAHEHWTFAGTRLLTGEARVRVAWTGADTVYGGIVRSAAGGRHARTPLQSAIQNLVTVLVVAASVLCLGVAVARLRQGHGWIDALVSAVTLATAALPEEFPVVFTVFLGVGVYRLARRQALVRRAVSVENIGRVTCICTDKTGTLTEGRLALTHLVPATGVTERRLLVLAATASRPDTGDPLDQAVAREATAHRAGAPLPVLAVFPFTEDRKRETAIAQGHDGSLVGVVKGAAETVLSMCEIEPGEGARWARAADDLAAGGHKVLAVASRSIAPDAWRGDELERDYGVAGLLAFEDPVRKGVAEAVAQCRAGGIHTIMLTGDHPLTARAVAREVGLGTGEPRVVTAEDLGAESRPTAIDVVARATPAQKLALVRRLQEAGEIVAVTGDGVNDVPALQAADVGIAMGERGTRSAREVAAIVLLDDDFATIARAIGEGRQLFRNLQASFLYLLAIHMPLVLTASLIPLAGYPLLYLPVHVVWIELIIHPTALLVFQRLPARHDPPRVPPGPARFFSAREWLALATSGVLLTAVTAVGFVSGVDEGGDVGHGRAMALAMLTLASAALTVVLSGLATPAARYVALATTVLSVALIEIPAAASALHLVPLHLADWALAVTGSVIGVLPLMLVSARRRAVGARER
jgi:Ca2+-transporting ATPase